ncbi:MAG: class II glutamine amidotransferase [Myxococcaceae bacterium]
MCRLFAFRSNLPCRVHQPLVQEKNSLRVQSIEHKDGWGIASYDTGLFPQVARGLGAAHMDPEFERVSSLLSSHTVIAHLRLASVGPVQPCNAHPFIHRSWTFAHNGTLQRFADHQHEIEALIDADFRPLLRGDTDSERCFYLFLTLLRARSGSTDIPPLEEVARALALTARTVCKITEPNATKPSSTNFMVTDGRMLLATRRHRTLFFSNRRQRPDEPLPSPTGEPRNGDRFEQIVIASEQMSSEDPWHEVPEDSLIAVDGDLTFRRWTFDELSAR